MANNCKSCKYYIPSFEYLTEPYYDENELPLVSVGNWKPVEAKEIGKPQEKIEVANFESDYRKNAVYLEDDCKLVLSLEA